MRLVALILILIAPTWAAAEKYICLAEKASGFGYLNGEWIGTKLTANEKYLVSFDERKVSIFGRDTGGHENCNFLHFGSIIYCQEGFGTFIMNKKNLRFMSSHPFIDYVRGNTEGTPNITIGTCSKF